MRPSLTLAVMLALASIAVAVPPKHAERSKFQPEVHEGEEYTVLHFPRNVEAGNAAYVQLFAINDQGQAAGTINYSDQNGTVDRAIFLDSDGVLYELPLGPSGRATSSVYVTPNGVPLGWGVVWRTDATIQTVHGNGVLPLRGVGGSGAALTESRELAWALARMKNDGECERASVELRRIVQSATKFPDAATDAKYLVAPGRSAQGLFTDSGAVVGNLDVQLQDGRAVRRGAVAQVARNGATADVLELGTLGGEQSAAAGINSRGDVVGEAELADGSYRPYVARRRGTKYAMTEVPLSDGADQGAALSINEAGVIVGVAWQGTTPQAFYHAKGRTQPLTDLVEDTGFDRPLIIARHVTARGHMLAATQTFTRRGGDGSYRGDAMWLLTVPCDTVILRNK